MAPVNVHTHPADKPASGTKKKSKGSCGCGTCSTCVSIPCFERPRFFCGQLLTDKDLDAAQRYVIEKNKLHNRYVVGAGVVCGMAVRCDECSPDKVRIEAGYAIDCCGNDIVLCEADDFNVREYLEKCLGPKDDGCGTKIKTQSMCDDVEKEYCIFACYAEEDSRPITAMVRNGTCSTTRCEPSRTKETHQFYLIEESKIPRSTWKNSLLWKALQCVLEHLDELGGIFLKVGLLNYPSESDPIPEAFQQKAYTLFCDIRNLVIELYKSGPNIRCNLVAELEKIEAYYPPKSLATTDPAKYLQGVHNAITLAIAFLIEYLIDCFCDALLTPCPECPEPHGVLLACLTIKNNQVQSICNTARTQVISGPRVRYWLEPVFYMVHRLFEYLCCDLDLVSYFEAKKDMKPFGVAQMQQTFEMGKTAYKMAGGYGGTILNKAKEQFKTKVSFSDLVNPQKVTISKMYGKPIEEVQREFGTKYQIRTTTAKDKAEAYDFKRLKDMAWVLPEEAELELMVDPETRLVTGVFATTRREKKS
jgi:hypothetical protein